MENFRPGVMDRLGIGYEALRAINPKLIYCTISGFGSTGPYRNEAGYDGKIQALSGIMSLTGHKEMGPTRAGFAVCDVLSGMTAAFAVSSALFQRTHTGQGQFIDVSMLEASLAFLSTQVADFTVAGHRQEQFGNQAISRKVTANLFRAKDSFLLLAVNNDRQYEALMTTLGRADVLDDPRFADWFQRKETRSGVARDHRGRAGECRCEDVGEAAERRRRAVRQHLADRGGHRSSADRRASRGADGGDRVWAAASDGFRLSDGAWRREAGPCAAAARRAHRRGAARGWLRRGRNCSAAARRGGLMDLRLKDKVALITGSSRGIGLATAQAFAAEGCRLMLSARSGDALRAAETALRANGATVVSEVADVTQPDDAARLVLAAVAAFGGIDILINNVGGGGGGRQIADSTDDEWRAALERNLVQTVRMMRLALPHMRGRAGAAVVNVSSISGWTPQLVGSGQYGAAKAALIFDTERWALEFVPHGVRVNTVSPGSILVEGNGWDRYRLANRANYDDYVRGGFPMGRLGTAEEVADVIVFLASPRAHWVNGRNVPVDGLEQPYAPIDWRPY